MTQIPRFVRVRQEFDGPEVANVEAAVDAEMAKLNLQTVIKSGDSVAITAGSRGIANIAKIIRAAVKHLQAIGAKPFIVPAMGSHGGGTAEGQQKVIEAYGITEEFVGCSIRSSMETVEVCQATEGFPVHFDKNAFKADHVIVCGRIKPHTGFVGPIESGLMKMMLIGLGKHNGAKIYHRAIQNYSFDQILRSVGREVIRRCRIRCGIAIVENQRDETAIIEALLPEQFESREPELLVEAKRLIPSLPFDSADVLIVDEIGKNISGTGMDTNLIGRKYNDHEPRDFETPKIKRIIVRDLTNATHGNATGIGIAEFCHQRVVDKMNVAATRANCLTGGHPTAAMIPLAYESDAEILEAALQTIGLTPPSEARILWIRNTLDVIEFEASEAYLPQITTIPTLKTVFGPREIPFDSQGNLPWQIELEAANG